MNWFTYDIESYKHDFFVVFKNKETGEYFDFHNDNEGVREFINEYGIFCGFNTKSYDQYIIKAICAGFSPYEVKQLSDWLVNSNNQGWQYPQLQGFYYRFNNIDIRDDTQQGLSLKAIAGHLGLPVVECSIPFDLDRPLKEDEIKEVFRYCHNDVDIAEAITNVRKDYLNNKLQLGRQKGIDDVTALSMTNAKLTAMYLDANKQEYNDERDYQYPANLRVEYIPQEVFDFFDKLHDKSISDNDLFKSKLTLNLGECIGVIGFGGIHAAIPNFMWKEGEE